MPRNSGRRRRAYGTIALCHCLYSSSAARPPASETLLEYKQWHTACRRAVGNAVRGLPWQWRASADAGNGTESVPYRKRALIVTLVFAATIFSGVQAQELSTPDSTAAPTVAPSSDLSSAFPPADWLRVERSVDLGLAWLASQQAADGSFPSNPVGQPAVTSLAVMAFLSRGHTPGHGKYGQHLSRAIDFVLAQQNRRGYFSLLQVAPPAGHLNPPQTLLYNHCISGLMLGEVYGMTSGAQSSRIEEAIAKALVFSRSVQTRRKERPEDVGGLRYAYPDSPVASSDLSVTGWALMFYRSARNAEFEVPKQYVDEGLDFIERCYVADPAGREAGVFRYRPLASQPDAQPSLANTGSALLSLLLGGRHDSEMVGVGSDWYRTTPYPKFQSTGHFFLACYYSSQATAQIGGETWDRVYPQIAATLLQGQTADGSWPAGRGNELTFGSTYSTSMAVLALTPPYQLLPIYQR